jgi:hypothetical protein
VQKTALNKIVQLKVKLSSFDAKVRIPVQNGEHFQYVEGKQKL